MTRPTAAALVIGNELLSGKIADRNVVVLSRALRARGVLLRRVVMMLDELEALALEVRALAASHDLVFTSGGVGPTHDDVTVDAVARAFGVGVVREPSLEALLRLHYRERLTDDHLLMARVPEGARLLGGPSAASDRKTPWPAIVMRNVWLLPGVPEIFELKMQVLAAELERGSPFVTRAVRTTLDEGTLKAALDRVVAAHPDVEIGSYPTWSHPRYRTKLTFDGASEAAVVRARDALIAALPVESIVPDSAVEDER